MPSTTPRQTTPPTAGSSLACIAQVERRESTAGAVVRVDRGEAATVPSVERLEAGRPASAPRTSPTTM